MRFSLIKRVVAIICAGYAAALLIVFAYCVPFEGWGGALLWTDHLLISGPVKRVLHPVSSDEELITRFVANRAKFDALVGIHRERCFDAWTPDRQPGGEHADVGQLKSQIGLTAVKNATGRLWLPEPYSQKSFDFELVTMKQSSPEERKKLRCRHGAPSFYFEQFPADPLAKGVIYFPVPPTVANGKLLRPSSNVDQPYRIEPVLDTLDHLPAGFWRRQVECAFRPIDRQWYLFACPSAMKK